jgi:hypothetical protein
VGRHLYADVNRHDLAQAFPFGSRHGFSGRALVVDPGSHTVCVTASNVGPGVHKNLGCRSVTVSDIHAPIGNFDGAAQVAGGIEVTGWASDPDTAAPIYVWVTVDGVGRHLYADEDRRDVGRHGFRGTISASSTSGHTVCVTASNVSRGRHTNLGCKRVPPRVDAHSPFGMFEAAFHPGEYPFELVVRGWAIDPDTDAPIYVWVTINGVGRHLYANVSRPDVAAAFPTYGPDHGYVALLAFDGPESPDPRGPTVCVTASNVGAGTHTLLGCRILQW